MVEIPIKRVAVIGAGPAGAITLDALMQEKTFDLVRVFERRHEAGGCWSGDDRLPPTVSNIAGLGHRTADPPLTIPKTLPALLPKSDQQRFDEATVYPYLETNVIADAMQYSQEYIPAEVSHLSRNLYGDHSPYRHWKVMRQYIHGLVKRNGYEDLVCYNTSVEKAEKVASIWRVTLRRSGEQYDYWWQEEFDAIIVANGHYNVPYIPPIPGLDELEKFRPGSVIHSKHFRGRDRYIGKRIVVVGVSVSAADIAFDLTSVAASPVHAITIGHTPNLYFGDEAFNHPLIRRHPSISKVAGRTVHLKDGTHIANVDHIIFGTGYTWTIPFLSHAVKTRNNRVPYLYQHIVWQHDPTLLFVGAVSAGLTFKVFEWQAVYAASLLSGRGTLPSLDEMRRWEEERMGQRGDGPKFVLVYPDFEEYFETLRTLSGEVKDAKGRMLPKFRREWFRDFMDGHELRKSMWRRLNEEAKCKLKGGETNLRARFQQSPRHFTHPHLKCRNVALSHDKFARCRAAMAIVRLSDIAKNPRARRSSTSNKTENRRWTESDIEMYRRLHDEGRSDRDIASALGRTLTALQTKKCFGMKVGSKEIKECVRWTPQEDDVLRKLRGEVHSPSRIAEILGLPRASINSRLHKIKFGTRKKIKDQRTVWSDSAIQSMIEMKSHGYSISYIARALEIPRHRVSYKMKVLDKAADQAKPKFKLYSHHEDSILSTYLRSGRSWKDVAAAMPHRSKGSLHSRAWYLGIHAANHGQWRIRSN
ncbi:hypothetical protein AC578_4721 [Pseudocercospora eumusae]|uniref:Uncharacterized protein n=1 Tax=Pseudocercospora eumusae TaxID=321146 RepID=A0A139GZ22_9PEZI|nr:hypothetical protein AC578_4721 [Pseudocercospora eumusae]KXS95444.1 hypothetical protein AC578_4721 [Pseudocercospora eumusae]KXS95445.1 hypothetical protein AC578_4721 [Pseudocercospora eumusae]